MTKPKDPLEGYRGMRPEALRDAYRQQIEGAHESPAGEKYARYVLGVQAEKIMAGFEAEPEATRAVLTALIHRAEMEVRNHTRALLAMPDLTTIEAKIAHHEASVFACLLTLINQMIVSGHNAGRELAEGDEEV